MENEKIASPRTDRKTVERNRRNHMKTLYSKLNSLIPNQNSKETMALAEQLEEATNYITRLENELEKLKEKKEHLMGMERVSKSMSSGMMVELIRTPPHIEIHDMGSVLEVILISDFDTQFMFNEIIRLLQEEGADIVSAQFSVVNNQTYFHTIHSEVAETSLGFGAARISNRLTNFVHEYFVLSESVPQTVQQCSSSVNPLLS
ncbi:transcription factor bHLH162-like [Telopea speciosissima]|uniref:transcription factor bHLH162-like n=1 Tax=Telopea speciosissima TaxID=54955 RepID=UPI001CC7136F|nr:transcription factor bHLH162-like [Telopea speciosissima]